MLYRREIDGLRALSVIPVIFYHAGFDFFSGGFVGVDVFFVISGYLITSIIYPQVLDGTFSFLEFYERRARRILPALFTVLVICLPFSFFLLTPEELNNFTNSLISVIFFSSNILFWFDSGYFDKAAELKPLLHTWSLSVEEQYYLIFPVLLILLKKLPHLVIVGVLCALACVSLYMMLILSSININTAFYLLPYRGWEILCGAVIALSCPNGPNKKTHTFIADLGSIIGLCFLVFSILFFDNNTPFPSLLSLLPVVGAVLLIIFATPDTHVGKFLSLNFFVAIGLVSYSAYLWHQPLFSFARQYSQSPISSNTFILLILICAILSFITWRFIETPFRNRESYSQRTIFILVSIGSLVFIVIGMVGYYTKGFYQLKISEQQRLVLKNASASPMRAQCHTSGKNFIPPSSACEYQNGALKVAAFGDSHIVEIAFALANQLSDENIKIKHFSFSSCIPTYGNNYSGQHEWCSAWTDKTAEYIINNKDIETVVVSYRIHAHLFGKHDKKYPSFVDTVGSVDREMIWKSYVNILKHFQSHGKNVILVLQAPELPKSIDKLILKSTDPFNQVNGVSKSWWDSRSSFVTSKLSEIPAGVVVIDPAEVFCDGAFCFASKQGSPYYFDDNHLSISGAALISEKIRPFLKFSN